MKFMAVGVLVVAGAVLWLFGPLPAAAQEDEELPMRTFLRADQNTAPAEIRALIGHRNTLVRTISWQRAELEIAGTQLELEETKQKLSAAQAKLRRNNRTLAMLQSRLTPELKTKDPDLYAKTEGKLSGLKGTVGQSKARITLYQAKVKSNSDLVDEYMSNNAPGTRKYRKTTSRATYGTLSRNVQRLHTQARYVIGNYGYDLGTKKSSIKAAKPEDLMMAPDGQWRSTLAANAFKDKATVATHLSRLWNAQKAGGFSEADVEVAKKMLVSALLHATQRQASLLKDPALQARTKRNATAMGGRIFKQSRVTVQDLTAMYDLLIDTVDRTR